jgi:hypothetical protein
MSLTRDQFLERKPREVREVEVPGRGSVFVRELYSDEQAKLTKQTSKPENEVLAAFVVATACDKDGELLFTDDDAAALSSWPTRELLPIMRAASELSGLNKEDQDEILGNSEATTPSGSGTA